MDQHLKYGVDAAAAGAAFASLFGWLSPLLTIIASSMSIVWLGIQIYEWSRKKKGTP